MPAATASLLDMLLVVAGLVLVVTGLVLFIRSKSSTAASSVEAFGIKLNVTHPSLILVLAGVGLMLAPRLLPGLPDKEAGPKPAVAEAPQPATTAPASAEPAPATPPATPQPTAAVEPVKPAAGAPVAATMTKLPSPPSGPVPVPYPSLAARAPPASATVDTKRPVAKSTTVKAAATPVATLPPAVATTRTPAAAKAAPQVLAYAALGLPISRSFWSGETRASYTQRLHAALEQAGHGILRMEPQRLELDAKAFDAWWNEPAQHPRSRELCAAAAAPAALLAVRVETPTTISSVESAYWPELKLRLFVCATQRIHRQQKVLAPRQDDAWPFATDVTDEIERFLRAYRGDRME